MKGNSRLNRRKFVSAVSMGTAAALLPGGNYLPGIKNQQGGKLAIRGGEPFRKKPFVPWPQSNSKIEGLLIETAKSGKWYRFESGAKTVSTFERKFAELIGTKYCLGTGSGTQALHTALYAVGVEAGDEVLVSPL